MRRLGAGIREGVRRLFVPAVRGKRRSVEDMEIELRAHFAARVEYLIARGVSPDAARAEAERRFGGFDRALENLSASALERERVLRPRDRMTNLSQDLRFVIRGLRRSPAFTIGVIATLAIGLGVNSAVFRIADRVLLRAPEGVVNAGSLRRVHMASPQKELSPLFANFFSYSEARAIADSKTFGGVAIYSSARLLRSNAGTDVPSVFVDSGFFALLGVKPSVGRFFDAHEAEPGAEEPVAVVSHAFWQRELGNANLSGTVTITLGTRTYRVVGVTPAGFIGVDLDPVDVWMPLGVAQMGRSVVNGVPIPWWRTAGLRPVRVLARVIPSVSDDALAARATTVLARSDEENGLPPRSMRLRSIAANNDAASGANTVLLARLAGVSFVVLLIAVANAGNLLLARSLRRRKEIAVRVALGGSRGRLLRLLLLESCLLGLASGLAALLAGFWTGEALRRLAFPESRWATVALDDRTLVFTLLVALAAGLIAGLAPAAQLSNPDVLTALKGDVKRTGRGSRLTRSALVLAQTAFSLALLIASGLLVRSLHRLNEMRIGFEPNDLVTAGVPNRTEFSALLGEFTGQRASATDLAPRLAQQPDVRAVALASNVPFGATAGMDFRIPGRTLPEVERGEGPYYSKISANYFAVMGTRVVRGRQFFATDTRGTQPVAVVNESMAKTYWPDGDPFSNCLLLPALGTCARVVGIVEDVRDTRGIGPAMMRYYLPIAQTDDSAAALIVRTRPGRAPFVAAAIKSVIPTQQRPSIEVIADRVARPMRPWRLATLLFTTIGILALALACLGVYSVMSYVASERVHELGVRMVLGATPTDLARVIAGSGLRLVVLGAVVGIIGAAFGSRLLSALLFGVSPFDPVVYFGAALLLCAMGLIATLMPALRVMRTDPTVALRVEG